MRHLQRVTAHVRWPLWMRALDAARVSRWLFQALAQCAAEHLQGLNQDCYWIGLTGLFLD